MREKRGVLVALALLGIGAAGCWDDEVTTNPVDAGVDVRPDTSLPDAPLDTQTEAATETGTETGPETGPDTGKDVESETTNPDVVEDVVLPPPSGTIQVLTINDFHGQIDPITVKDKDGYTNYLGGVAYASTYFQKERAANPNTILRNGGDEVGASPTLSAYGTDLRDEPAIVSLNYLGVNASNIGNHSFDDGTAHFKDLMEIADFDYVGVNVEDPKNELGGHVVKPYKMLTFGDPANPIKVAVVGVSNPETEEIVIAGHMGDVKITEPVAPANAAIAQARADGAHVVLVTAHIGATGLNTDGSGAPIGPIVDFAKNINGADLVQGGHTEAEVNWKMGDVMLVQSDGQLTAYNKVLITVEDGVVTDIQGSHVQVLGKKAITLSASCKDNTAQCPTGFECVAEKLCEQVIEEPDPAVATMIEPWKTHVKELFDEKVGTVDGVWPRNGIVERSQEVPMGDIITDAILDSYAGLGIQIAFMNGGGIRDSMPSSYKPTDTSLVRVGCSTTTPCDVVLGDIYSILPFNNTVVLRDVPGSVVWDVVEFSVSTVEANHGRFLQVGGIKVTYKASAAPGARVQSILFTGDGSNKPITKTDTTIYRIAVNDFMNTGGDGYEMLKEEVPTVPWGLFNDAVADYIKKVKDLKTPEPFQRIIAIP